MALEKSSFGLDKKQSNATEKKNSIDTKKVKELENKLRKEHLKRVQAEADSSQKDQGLAKALMEQFSSGKVLETGYKGTKSAIEKTATRLASMSVDALRSTFDHMIVTPAKFAAEVSAVVGKSIAENAASGIKLAINVMSYCKDRGINVPVAFWKEIGKATPGAVVAVAKYALEHGISIPGVFWKEVLVKSPKVLAQVLKTAFDAGVVVPASFYAKVAAGFGEVIAKNAAKGVMGVISFIEGTHYYGVQVPRMFWDALGNVVAKRGIATIRAVKSIADKAQSEFGKELKIQMNKMEQEEMKKQNLNPSKKEK